MEPLIYLMRVCLWSLSWNLAGGKLQKRASDTIGEALTWPIGWPEHWSRRMLVLEMGCTLTIERGEFSCTTAKFSEDMDDRLGSCRYHFIKAYGSTELRQMGL